MDDVRGVRCARIEPTTDPARFEDRVSRAAPGVRIVATNRDFTATARVAFFPRVALMKLDAAAMRVLSTPRGYVSVTMPLSGSVRIDDTRSTQVYRSGSAHVLHPRDTFQVSVPRSVETLVVNLEADLFAIMGDRLNMGLEASRPFSLSSPRGADFSQLCSFLWAQAQRSAVYLSDESPVRALEDALVTALLRATWGDEEGVADAPALRRARDFMAEHLDMPLCVADVVEAAGTSARTLFRMFQERYGMGPLAWHRERRLEAVHRALRAADPSHASVTSVALRFAFSHLGRFANEYRRAYGESPSRTLRR